MTAEKLNELIEVDGLTLQHTYRGYYDEVEVYTTQANNKVYSLYRRPDQATWQCDWTASYNCQPVDLKADASDIEAMLKAFAAHLKSLQSAGH